MFLSSIPGTHVITFGKLVTEFEGIFGQVTSVGVLTDKSQGEFCRAAPSSEEAVHKEGWGSFGDWIWGAYGPFDMH